jgi:hypothetical protein
LRPDSVPSWWPNAPLDRLQTVAFYNLWLFIWDDDIERHGFEKTEGDLFGFHNVETLQAQALGYIAFHLGLLPPSVAEPISPTPSCLVLLGPCHTLREECDEGMRRRFYHQIEFFMECCALEYRDLRQDVLPSTDEYWRLRLGTSSVYTLCALAE